MGTSRSSSRPRSRHTPDLGLLLRLNQKLQVGPAPAIARQRRLVADLCRLLGAQLHPSTAAPNSLWERSAPLPVSEPSLSPRMRQTLQCLLAGDSEKQIASRLHLSPHTVHVYVKALYARHAVSSRGELLARFIRHDEARDAPHIVGFHPAMTGRNNEGDANGSRDADGSSIGDEAWKATTYRAIPQPVLGGGRTEFPTSPNGNSHEGLGGLTKED
jgi:DNA-binding CsgD family transcriptional regulator